MDKLEIIKNSKCKNDKEFLKKIAYICGKEELTICSKRYLRDKTHPLKLIENMLLKVAWYQKHGKRLDPRILL